MKAFLYSLICGEWSCGWEWYKDKPKFGFFHAYFDGYHYVFHSGKFWVEVDY